MARILIIDDDPDLAAMLTMMAARLGHEGDSATTLAAGLDLALGREYAVVFLDVWMPDGNGLDLLPRLRDLASSPEVIIMTGLGESRGAELAIRNGAWDYIEKTALARDFELSLSRALQFRREKSHRPPVVLQRAAIVGKSPRLLHCLELVGQAAASQANVLISGETGTGKELFARAIHDNSTRARKNFVVVDCAALPGSLVESILFGHVKGAFTGADQERRGLIHQADGGTLFLDEIGELPGTLQKTFLRVLQERRFRPVGSKQEVASNFRLIAATNRDLFAMVEAGGFRADLFYRLHALPLALPALRERPEDIRSLALAFIAGMGRRYQVTAKDIAADFFAALEAYDWPGNVRELKNTIEQVLLQAGEDQKLFANHLPVHIRVRLATSQLAGRDASAAASPQGVAGLLAPELPSLKEFRRQASGLYAQALRARFGGDMKKAGAVAGLSRSRLYAFLKDHPPSETS
jgi:two-component system NtrC family response regulator